MMIMSSPLQIRVGQTTRISERQDMQRTLLTMREDNNTTSRTFSISEQVHSGSTRLTRVRWLAIVLTISLSQMSHQAILPRIARAWSEDHQRLLTSEECLVQRASTFLRSLQGRWTETTVTSSTVYSHMTAMMTRSQVGHGRYHNSPVLLLGRTQSLRVKRQGSSWLQEKNISDRPEAACLMTVNLWLLCLQSLTWRNKSHRGHQASVKR